jgi:hypothetical protein
MNRIIESKIDITKSKKNKGFPPSSLNVKEILSSIDKLIININNIKATLDEEKSFYVDSQDESFYFDLFHTRSIPPKTKKMITFFSLMFDSPYVTTVHEKNDIFIEDDPEDNSGFIMVHKTNYDTFNK